MVGPLLKSAQLSFVIRTTLCSQIVECGEESMACMRSIPFDSLSFALVLITAGDTKPTMVSRTAVFRGKGVTVECRGTAVLSAPRKNQREGGGR